MPLESYPLQALVSEPIKPVHALRGDVEHHPRLMSASPTRASWSSAPARTPTRPTRRPARCTSPRTRSMRSASCSRSFRRMRMLRNWGGIVDVTPDRSPIIGKTPVPGLFVNCGWGTGGFKATPGLGPCVRLHDRARRAAPDRRAVHARALPHRPADRRSGRRRRGALRVRRHAADPLPLLRRPPRTRIPLRRRGAHRAPDGSRRGLGRRTGRSSSTSAPIPRACTPSAGGTRHGCGRFFNAVRDTVTDKFVTTYKARRAEAAISRRLAAGAATMSCQRPHDRDERLPHRVRRTHRPRRPLRSASTAATTPAMPGDTLASALIANGVHLVGRSFKYHRPRGICGRRRGGAERAGRRAARARRAPRRTCAPRRSSSTTGSWPRARTAGPRWPSTSARSTISSPPALPCGLLLQDLHVAARRLEARSTSR